MTDFEKDLIESAEQAAGIAEGRLKPARVTQLELNVSKVRRELALSRDEFAGLMGVSKRTVEAWEQGLRRPSGSAAILILIAQEEPELIRRFA